MNMLLFLLLARIISQAQSLSVIFFNRLCAERERETSLACGTDSKRYENRLDMATHYTNLNG
jgi:hypothetical protein